jgi:hypothetical protein
MDCCVGCRRCSRIHCAASAPVVAQGSMSKLGDALSQCEAEVADSI